MTTKQELRKAIRQQKHPHAADESSAIMSQLLQNEHVRQAHIVMLYSALPDEVPTQQLIDELASQGKQVLLPRVVSETEMELRRYTSRSDLAAGAFGIMEPVGDVFSDYDTIDTAIIPGMAFDLAGHRLGRGRGYYDRFLSRIPHVYKIGVCYPTQLVEHVPTDEHDIMMDCIVTGKLRK